MTTFGHLYWAHARPRFFNFCGRQFTQSDSLLCSFSFCFLASYPALGIESKRSQYEAIKEIMT